MDRTTGAEVVRGDLDALQLKRHLRAAAIAEIAAMTVLLLSYIWLWQGAFRGHFLVVAAFYFGIGAWSNTRRGESLRDLGVRLDNWRPALRNSAVAGGPLILLALAVGAAFGSWHWEVPDLRKALAAIVWGLFWGTAQQYGLVCFFYRRLVDVLGDEWRASIGAALLFALFHFPNPFLMAVTVFAGTISCWLYRKEPNIFTLGVFHALISFALQSGLPPSITGRLRVGPGYLRWLGLR